MDEDSQMSYTKYNASITESPSAYIGETARNLYTWAIEHQQNYDVGKSESFMMRHQRDDHRGAQADVSVKILIQRLFVLASKWRYKHKVLNSKVQWHRPALWRVHSELSQEWEYNFKMT